MKIKTSMLLVLLYAGVLALVPFTWWPANQHLVGGDDIKYEYVKPATKLASLLDGNLARLSVSESAVIHEVSGFPFYLVITTLRKALPFINTQQLINSFILAGSFLAFFWMIAAIPIADQPQGRFHIVGRFVAANVYALSTFNIPTMWSHQLPEYVYMATLPLIIGFLIRSATRYSAADSTTAALILAISPSPYGSAPWLIPVAICGLPLAIALAINRPRDTLWTSMIFFFTTGILLFPTIISMIEFGGYSPEMFDSGIVKGSIAGFKALSQNNSLIYPIALTPNEWMLPNIPLYRTLPWLFYGAIIILAVIMLALAIVSVLSTLLQSNHVDKTVSTGVLLSWGLSIILYVGGGTKMLLTTLVTLMETFPLLIMFRSNYDKFGMAISLFSSIMVFYSLMTIYSFRTCSEATESVEKP